MACADSVKAQQDGRTVSRLLCIPRSRGHPNLPPGRRVECGFIQHVPPLLTTRGGTVVSGEARAEASSAPTNHAGLSPYVQYGDLLAKHEKVLDKPRI